MAKYRKKPVVIEARQFRFDSDWEALAKWCGGVLKPTTEKGPTIVIPTLEGDHEALLRDHIIKGIKGEFYPCKPDIFEATYEKVEE